MFFDYYFYFFVSVILKATNFPLIRPSFNVDKEKLANIHGNINQCLLFIFLFFRAYVTNLLTYGMDTKNSLLINQGWHADTTNFMEADNAEGKDNSGWVERQKWFRKNYKENGEWRQDGFTFMGRLQHELMGVDKCLPPGEFFSKKLQIIQLLIFLSNQTLMCH